MSKTKLLNNYIDKRIKVLVKLKGIITSHAKKNNLENDDILIEMYNLVYTQEQIISKLINLEEFKIDENWNNIELLLKNADETINGIADILYKTNIHQKITI